MDIDSIEHLFWQTVQIFWMDLLTWLNENGMHILYDKFASFLHSNNKITSYSLPFPKYYYIYEYIY